MSGFKQAIEDLRNFDIADLSDLDSVGVWPRPVKFVLIAMVVIACLAAGWFLHVQKLQEQFVRHQAEETSLRQNFEQKAFMAANLDEYRTQTMEMEEAFAVLLRQLPSRTEVPGLVDDVTNTGLGSGLEFSNIELSDEVTQEIYIELPIEIDVTGNYHDFATFVSGVAALPRIVTLHDFQIVRQDDVFLTMSITAKTYRYKEDEEEFSTL
ncbi:MAG: type 4a pilus biogenesis protein PilO [Gammaproteobacteria bacterium]|nr:type 4a pilus biogenesis protein PilO [Gammaproteobacteria bacterium]